MSSKKVFPHEIQELKPGQDKAVKDGAYSIFGGLISAGPQNMLLPRGYQSVAEGIYNFEPREDDVWIATFPRSGQSVHKEGAYLLHTTSMPFQELQ